jgi:hypothetical protein
VTLRLEHKKDGFCLACSCVLVLSRTDFPPPSPRLLLGKTVTMLLKYLSSPGRDPHREEQRFLVNQHHLVSELPCKWTLQPKSKSSGEKEE